MSATIDQQDTAETPSWVLTLIARTPAEIERLPKGVQWKLLTWLRGAGQIAAAKTVIESIEARSGCTVKSLEEQIQVAILAGDQDGARTRIDDLLNRSSAVSTLEKAGRWSLEIGDIEGARRSVTALAEQRVPGEAPSPLELSLLMNSGDVTIAREMMERWQEEHPDSPYIALGLARCALLDGDRDSANRWLDMAVAHGARNHAQAAGLATELGRNGLARAILLDFAIAEAQRGERLAAEIRQALSIAGFESAQPGDADSNFTDDEGHHALQPVGGAASANGRTREQSRSEIPHSATANADGPPDDRETAKSEIATEMIDVSANEPPLRPAARELLQSVFGFDSLRPGQATIIERALDGASTLAILPTGGGKSLTFQLPALLLPGVTLVISPLIALMKDQVDRLPPALESQARAVTSALSRDEQQEAVAAIARGEVKLVYAAPERLRQPAFLSALRAAGVSLVVVDEAHCIAQWGHDFRPDYLWIPAALPELGNPPILALTATATKDTSTQIAAAFAHPLAVVRTSSFRKNLFYRVERLSNREDKAARLIELCKEERGSIIVYISSRRDADTLAGVLRDNRVSAVSYHAGLDPDTRRRNQEAFMSGRTRVIVATIAFGMGIDKRDVRSIIHFRPATSLDAYAQESGRAGRDGMPANCTMLFTQADRTTLKRLASSDEFTIDQLRQIYSEIRNAAIDRWAIFDPSRIVLQNGDDEEGPDPRLGIGLLERAGLLKRHANAPVSFTLSPKDDAAATGDDPIVSPAADWDRFADWAELDSANGSSRQVSTARACSALNLNPEELEKLVQSNPAWSVRDGARLSCIEILPAPAHTKVRIENVLHENSAQSNRRVERMFDYAEGRRCRHATIADYLGEALPACEVVCDVCTASVAGAPAVKRKAATRRTLASDRAVVLQALASMPFSVGKKGLSELLVGSVTSRVQAERSRYFGAMQDVTKTNIGKLIDDMVGSDLLAINTSRGFPLLEITPEGEQFIAGEAD